MATGQISTPWDKKLAELLGKTKLQQDERAVYYGVMCRVEGYRMGVTDTEARYAELVAAAEGVVTEFPKPYSRFMMFQNRLSGLQAALAKVKGVEHGK